MRWRYVAYIQGRTDYLLQTWHPATRPVMLDLEGEPARWIGLQVRRVEAGSPGDEAGIVEFAARYKVGGRAYWLHEVSRFVREQGRWFYQKAQITS
jgi:SEC-C motif-containing protein